MPPSPCSSSLLQVPISLPGQKQVQVTSNLPMIREMNPVPGGLLQRGMPTVAAAYQSPPPPQLQQARSSPRTSPTQQQQQVASNLPPGIPLVPQQQQPQYSMNQQLLLLGRQGLQTTPGYTPPGTPPDFEYTSSTPNVRS